MAITKPQAGEDTTKLWRNVVEICEGVNSLMNMTGQMEGRTRALGFLRRIGDKTELRMTGASLGDLTGGITKKNTTCRVSSSKNPATVGASVFWTATVASDAGGTMQFRIDGANWGGPVGVVSGIAVSAPRTTLNPGSHNIQAFYSGNYLYNPAVGSMVQRISALVPDITIESNINPAMAAGQHPPTEADRVVWTVHLYPPNPPAPPAMTGKVQFYIDNHPWGNPVTIETITSLHYRALSPAWDASDEAFHYVIKGRYLGNFNFEAVETDMDQYVKSQVSAVLAIAPNPAQPTEQTAYSVRVDPPAGKPKPTGQVQLRKDGVAWGVISTLVNGFRQFLVPPNSLAVGDYTIFARYFGDSKYGPTNSNVVTLVISLGTPVTMTPYIAEPLPNLRISYWFDGTGGYGFNAYNAWNIGVGGGFNGIMHFQITGSYVRISQNGIVLVEGQLNLAMRNGYLTLNPFVSGQVLSADVQMTGGAGLLCIGVGAGGFQVGGNIIIEEGWIDLQHIGGINGESPLRLDLLG